jgi:hypothetical protein
MHGLPSLSVPPARRDNGCIGASEKARVAPLRTGLCCIRTCAGGNRRFCVFAAKKPVMWDKLENRIQAYVGPVDHRSGL